MEKWIVNKRVYYDATDAGGIVYHTEYLKFCEQARSELFFQQGIFFEDGGYVIKRVEADYLGSAKLGDILEIETTISKIGNSFVEFNQKVMKEGDKIFQMKAVAVYIDESGKIGRIPPRHRVLLNLYLQKGEF
ncbi:MAG: acyl-CoA thioester hydrolase [Epsilonproteobacteria bacterium]|nr:acyl-CoA thioester hydrolase [Campylobacterota bacterium]NPA89057.1 YbgC/FadM family acyl-CoA thioesterase [Campylobacterota bacterium]